MIEFFYFWFKIAHIKNKTKEPLVIKRKSQYLKCLMYIAQCAIVYDQVIIIHTTIGGNFWKTKG